MTVDNFKNIILFDQDTQHYRQSIYSELRKELKKYNYQLYVFYDEKLNSVNDNEFIFSINYSFKSFITVIEKYKPAVIIQFVWLKYKFLFLYMLYAKLRRRKVIVWSHGLNMQHKNQLLKNQLYYLRQYLADALLIYSRNEKKYIKASHKKLFIANNTLNFNDFYIPCKTKDELKVQYGYENKFIFLCVGRLDTHNRDINILVKAFNELNLKNKQLIIVGPGIDEDYISNKVKVKYFGPVYDNKVINEIYKMSDVFIMPGPIGLAINHAFYFGLPVIIPDVNHGPEYVYFKNEQNGLIYKKCDYSDLRYKMKTLADNKDLYDEYSKAALETVKKEASIENMLNSIIKSIEFVTNE